VDVRHRRVGDRGQVVPLLAVLLVVAAAAVVLVAVIGGHLVDRARARAAADAGALAAALGTDADGAEVVAANGAVLVRIERGASVVEVEVRVGRTGARARAERAVVVDPPPGREGPPPGPAG